MTTRRPKKPASETPPERVLDLRPMLQRAAEDDPLISANFTLDPEDNLLHCLHCYFVTRQELNAEAHLQARHPELIDPPADEEA